MKRFYLFFSREPEGFLEELQNKSMVEIDKLPESLGFETSAVERAKLDEKISRVEFLKNVLKQVEGKEFSGRILLTEEEEKEILSDFPLPEIYEKFSKIVREKERRAKISNSVLELEFELEPVKNLEIAPSELFALKNFSFCLFGLDKKMRRSPGEMEGLKPEKVGETKRQVFWLAVFHKNNEKKVLSDIEGMQGKILKIRRWNKKPADIAKKLAEVLKKNEKIKKEKEKELEKLKILKNRLFVYYDHLKTLYHYTEARKNMSSLKFARGFSGWVKEKEIPAFEALVKKRLPEAYLRIENPDVNGNIPIALENTRFVEPFEVVTDLYGKPIYRNIDPTVHLSLFFAISFGFCITDAGYGILLAVFSLLLMKKFRLMPSFTKFLRLLFYGGIASVVMGTITGSWFGDTLSRLPGHLLPVKAVKSLIVLDPLGGGNNTFIFLGWAIIIGFIQLVWGLVLNVFNSVRLYGVKKSGEAFSLLAIQLLTGILVSVMLLRQKLSIPASAVSITAGLLVISFVYFMITKARDQKGIAMKIFWAVYGAYNVIAGNLLGDTLSYSRLFGLGLTTAVLGLVVNEMVSMSKAIPYAGYIIAVLLFVAGHLGNLAINLLGSYVHTSRLQYLEFFTKFFESGGRQFKPFSHERRYTCISKNR